MLSTQKVVTFYVGTPLCPYGNSCYRTYGSSNPSDSRKLFDFRCVAGPGAKWWWVQLAQPKIEFLYELDNSGETSSINSVISNLC